MPWRKIKRTVPVFGPECVRLEEDLILRRLVIQNLSVEVFLEVRIKEDQGYIYLCGFLGVQCYKHGWLHNFG